MGAHCRCCAPATSPSLRMKNLPLFLAALALGCSARGANMTASTPNIVILYADDMGFGDVAIQNAESKIPTPNLDQLAREGMRFTDAHSSSGICSPSRYALLTGRFHWRKFHGIVNSFGPSVFDPAELTLPRMLQQQGYRTACIGKWHLGWDWEAIKRTGAKPDPKTGYAPDAFDWTRRIPGGPRDQGFDYYFGDDVPNFPPYTWFENDRVLITPTEPLKLTRETAEGNWEARPGPMAPNWDFYGVMPKLTERAVAWVGEQRGQTHPFFLYVPFTSPHAPIVPAPEFVGKSKAGGYGDYVVQTDDTVGRILRALEENGFRDNTIVIFTADNGPEHYAYERIHNFQHRSMGPLRGLKRDLWEGGHRVPFIVRWPGQVPPNEVTSGLASQVDVMATIAAVTGYALPPRAADDSHNLLPLWKDAKASSPRRTIVHNTQPNGYAIRHDHWLLVDAPTGGVSKQPTWFNQENGYKPHSLPGELYDLAGDLAEQHNLYGNTPDKVAELKTLLAQVRARGQVR